MALLSLEELIKMQGKLHKSLLCQCVLHLKQYHGAAVYPQPLMLHPVNSKHGSKGKQTNVGHPIVWTGESAFQPVKQLLNTRYLEMVLPTRASFSAFGEVGHEPHSFSIPGHTSSGESKCSLAVFFPAERLGWIAVRAVNSSTPCSAPGEAHR